MNKMTFKTFKLKPDLSATRQRGLACLLAFASLFVTQVVTQANAQTLKSALGSAYLNNPTLKAERAALRSTDEGVAQARSGYRPTISAEATATSQWTESEPGIPTSDGHLRSRQLTLSVSQPIFRGLRTINSVRQADDSVLAGREQLRNVEQQILLQTVTAYMDVVRNQAILKLRKNNANVLEEQLKGVQDRFEVGEVTRTDVAQAQARHSRALSDINVAISALKTSRSNYQLAVGTLPRGTLSEPPSIESYLPRSLGESLKRGGAENPQILAAIYQERASRHNIDVIRGESLPEVNLNAQYQRTLDPSNFTEERDVTLIQGRVTIPLYQAGQVSSRVRAAKQTNTQRQLQIDVARRQVHSDVVTAWGQMQSARAQISSGQASVNASRTALEGVREEEKVGQRTILDTLNAEQELLDAQVTLVQARREFVVAAFSLLSGTGRLTIAELNVPVTEYNPKQHYNAVRNKWRGTVTPDAAYYDQQR